MACRPTFLILDPHSFRHNGPAQFTKDFFKFFIIGNLGFLRKLQKNGFWWKMKKKQFSAIFPKSQIAKKIETSNTNPTILLYSNFVRNFFVFYTKKTKQFLFFRSQPKFLANISHGACDQIMKKNCSPWSELQFLFYMIWPKWPSEWHVDAHVIFVREFSILALAHLTDKMDPMYIIPKWPSELHDDAHVIFGSSSAHRLDGPHALCIKITVSWPQCQIWKGWFQQFQFWPLEQKSAIF